MYIYVPSPIPAWISAIWEASPASCEVHGISDVRTLFGRWQQRCDLSLSVLQQPVKRPSMHVTGQSSQEDNNNNNSKPICIAPQGRDSHGDPTHFSIHSSRGVRRCKRRRREPDLQGSYSFNGRQISTSLDRRRSRADNLRATTGVFVMSTEKMRTAERESPRVLPSGLTACLYARVRKLEKSPTRGFADH